MHLLYWRSASYFGVEIGLYENCKKKYLTKGYDLSFTSTVCPNMNVILLPEL